MFGFGLMGGSLSLEIGAAIYGSSRTDENRTHHRHHLRTSCEQVVCPLSSMNVAMMLVDDRQTTSCDGIHIGFWAGNHQYSGSGFFPITAKVCNLSPQLVDALAIAAGDGNGEGELKFLELMAALGIGALLGLIRTGATLGVGRWLWWLAMGHFLPILSPLARGQAAIGGTASASSD